MQISPRYDGPPLITMDGPVNDQRETVIRQRRRLQQTLESLTEEQWRAPSRCEGWDTQDVVAHLISTNGFWTLSIRSGLEGQPTRFLDGFDPKASPAALAEAARGTPWSTTLEQFVASNDELAATIEKLDDAGWSTPAEAPPGHIAVRAVAHHALWDSWVHERDIVLPLGLPAVDEPDEVAACLRYAAALGPSFGVAKGEGHTGTLAVEVTDPDLTVVVDVGPDAIHVHSGPVPADATLVLRGSAVDLVEALSIRGPLGQEVPDDARWLLAGLAEVFETDPALRL